MATTSSQAESLVSPSSSGSEEDLIAISESQFFPTPSDAIWRSATIIPHSLRPEAFDFLGPEENNNHVPDSFPNEKLHDNDLDGVSSDEEDITVNRRPDVEEKEDQIEIPSSSSFKRATSSSSDNKASKARPEFHVPEDTALPSTLADPIRGDQEDAMQLIALRHRLPHLSPPGADASVEELGEKLECGLRFLDDLAHSNSSHDKDLKGIYDAYCNFARALFEDIKEPSRLKDGSDSSSDYSDTDWNTLERQKDEICEQETLLEKEILHYKATKYELQKIAEDIEEASKSYRKPDVLEDVIIPKDIKLSSSSEYVAEIEELQGEILRKQDMLKDMHEEIKQRLLPKALVDSVCESHRLAMQALRDIEEETTYLKECVSRLDLKYLYNLQIS